MITSVATLVFSMLKEMLVRLPWSWRQIFRNRNCIFEFGVVTPNRNWRIWFRWLLSIQESRFRSPGIWSCHVARDTINSEKVGGKRYEKLRKKSSEIKLHTSVSWFPAPRTVDWQWKVTLKTWGRSIAGNYCRALKSIQHGKWKFGIKSCRYFYSIE